MINGFHPANRARQEPDAEKDQGARNWADQLKAKVVFFAVAELMENERCDEKTAR